MFSAYLFFFSLVSRDLQSYLSDLSIFMGNKSKKIYILVDNRPWLNPGTRSAHFWQLMVTKVCRNCFQVHFLVVASGELTILSSFAVQTLPFCKLERSRREEKTEAGGGGEA